MKILLAEPSRVLASSLCGLLKEKGHEAEATFDGVQALDRLTHEKFDLLITEIDLPRIDGAKLVRMAKMRGVSVRTIGILSASEVTRECLGKGAETDAFLPKPFSGASLLKLISLLEEEKGEEYPNLSYWQKVLMRSLIGSEAVPGERLRPIFPEYSGGLRLLVLSTNDVLERVGGGLRIERTPSGYKVVNL